jgi:hypothetical protein
LALFLQEMPIGGNEKLTEVPLTLLISGFHLLQEIPPLDRNLSARGGGSRGHGLRIAGHGAAKPPGAILALYALFSAGVEIKAHAALTTPHGINKIYLSSRID